MQQQAKKPAFTPTQLKQLITALRLYEHTGRQRRYSTRKSLLFHATRIRQWLGSRKS